MSTKHPSAIPSHYITILGFEKVSKNEHMFEWLGLKENYLTTLVTNLEELLYKQDPGSIISSISLIDDPEFITGFIPIKENSGKGIICRLIVVMNIDVYITSSAKINYILHIKYTFHGQNLDNEKRHVRLDMDISSEEPIPGYSN